MAGKAAPANRRSGIRRRVRTGLQRRIPVAPMGLTVIAFLALLLAVAALRIVELQISKRHQKQIVADGGAKVTDPKFRWMVLLHTLVLIGAAAEVVFLHRPFLPVLATVSFVLFLVANAIRWWVIR